MSLTEHQPKQDHLDLNIWSESKIYNAMFLLPELFGLNIFIVRDLGDISFHKRNSLYLEFDI